MPSAGSSRIKVAPAPYRFNAADEQQSLLLSSPSSIRSDGAQPIPAYDGIQSGTRSVLPCADERPVLAPSPLVASSTPTAEQVTTQCGDFGDQEAATKDQVAQAQQLLHIKLGGKLAFGEAVTSILHRVCGLTDLDCKMIADNFAKSGDDWLAHVLSIDLSINAIGASGVRALAAAIGQAQRLQCLSLFANQLCDDGVASLSRALRKQGASSLTRLDLGWNQIGDTGFCDLARALADGAAPLLADLRVEGNMLTDASALELASALRHGVLPYLAVLVLGTEIGGNCIGDAGLDSLVGAFTFMQQLKELSISNNQISCNGAVALANALCLGGGESLERLQLQSNLIGERGLQALEGLHEARESLAFSWLPQRCCPGAVQLVDCLGAGAAGST